MVIMIWIKDDDEWELFQGVRVAGIDWVIYSFDDLHVNLGVWHSSYPFECQVEIIFNVVKIG